MRFVLASVLVGTVAAHAGVQAEESIPSTVDDGKSNTDPSWYCDSSNYCDGGGTCCPVVGGSGFKCAPSGQRYVTCSMDGASYCGPSAPIVCGSYCCPANGVCRDGSCYFRTSSNSLNDTMPGVASRRPKIEFTKVVGPPDHLGWFPSNWGNGMLHTVMKGLHEDFLAVQAVEWRSTSPKPGNCWVVGFPSDLSNCDANKPWDDGCKGSSATITQDGEYTFYNNNPTFAPTNYDRLDWCNDDKSQSQSYTHSYSVTESQSASTTLSSSVKATVGMSTTAEAKVDIGIASGSDSFTMHASLETDFSKSSTQTKSFSRAWSSQTSVVVGPRSHVYSTCWLQTGTFETPFDGRVKLNSPVVWACSSPETGPDDYLSPTDTSYWTSAGIEQVMEGHFGFAKSDLQDLFGQKIGGTFKAVAGQKVQCSTHTEYLKEGQSCPSAVMNSTVMV